MKPFDLEKALAGEPISFKGFKSYLHCSKKEKHIYIVESDITGTIWSPVTINELTECTMWEEQRPTINVTLPCPLKEPQPNMWYITSIFTVTQSTYSENSDKEKTVSNWILEKGLYFATKEDAQIWLDTLKNNRK